ncbi:hypothetical protein GCM10011376_33800 [Nocardioides flavus (ex Wang et al. 2016)]|uniref:Uncharacterized protein n=1 Tax=Nocardioides flavus (ex Wang et al. 2016) TaxID=2058780 RepID=A0ABQ3HM60_9ACTN|nr:hypothetical protein [Nocardioides flavus (ex Wang et al. 2016)]GHE18770.1 hypothetical protein GCM10011376_33800 [Nocardioides flavus (ex Wang et al. 2016)]
MDVRGVLTEGFGRITELYADAVDGLDEETLHHRPGGTGNPIGWLPAVGPARHRRRTPGQHPGRLPPAPRAGGVRTGPRVAHLSREVHTDG